MQLCHKLRKAWRFTGRFAKLRRKVTLGGISASQQQTHQGGMRQFNLIYQAFVEPVVAG
jgi:hypothetical protein